MVVVTTRSPHEDRLAPECALDDLETEDARIELGSAGRVANVQDGMVEARDGDRHEASLRPAAGACLRREIRARL